MKVLLYTIAGLIVIIWAILIVGFDTTTTVHILLLFALIIVIYNFLLGKKRAKKE